MKIKFTLARSGGTSVDLMATVDAATTVGDLAAHLVRADPVSGQPVPGRVTLSIAGRDQRSLDPHLHVGGSGLRSGAVVSIARGGEDYADPRTGDAAVVEVVEGPDAGRKFPLHRGTSVIGREPGCEVRLTDPLVSRQHARLTIADIAQITDLGSANGVQLGGAAVSRSVLRPGDRVRVGDTELQVRVLHATPAADDAAVAFVRSPRLDRRYEGVEQFAPEPPRRPQRERFPIVPLIAPVLMGAVLYLITKSVMSLAFVALSPLMIVGYGVESMLAGRSAFKKATAAFRAELVELAEEAGEANRAEVSARCAEHPSLADCTAAAREGGQLLWTRRPDGHGFIEIRLGTGRLPARNFITLPDPRGLPRELWTELVTRTESFSFVDGVPVVARPAEHGGVGVAGSRPAALAAARALVAQLAVLHSPAELVLTGFASAQTSVDWDWVKWLPHTTSPHSPFGTRHLAADTTSAAALLSELEALVESRADGEAPGPSVFVIVEDDAPGERSRLVELAEIGWRHGVHVLWLAVDVTLLPAACRTYLSVEHATGSGHVGYVHDGARIENVAVELLDDASATDLARRLAPLVDTGAKVDDASDLPRSISLLNVAEPALTPAAEVVLERWQENRSIVQGPCAPQKPSREAGTLRAVVGMSATGAHALDLRADGPHALVGGTTGSGKSELLQSWILALAVAHSPQRVTFLLVDYKGGSAFQEFEGLPHVVGQVTDLTPHLVHRALTSLSAELKNRERLFARYRVKDLAELERRDAAAAPPSLVIVVDEFAALVKELPEFVDGVVNVAQRGRSLGVHLILATQRPAGVIKDNLRANTNLRLALRTADEADSVDVLGSPQAAFFDPALPGRAVSKTGPGRLVPFQAGYAGGWTSDVAAPPEVFVEELSFGRSAVWQVRAAAPSVTDLGPTDITRMVRAVQAAFTHARMRPPHQPWKPPLAAVYDLMTMPSRSDSEIVFGVRDDPENQQQTLVAFRPDVDGNLAVFGTGGTGKSTLLRVIAAAVGDIRTPLCHVYGLDFSGHGLAMLEELPHVGSVIAGSDHERVARLLGWLRGIVNERAARYAKADAGTITDYRAKEGATPDPRILVLLDGVGAFRKAYEATDHSRWFDVLVAIASEGRQVGVHLVLSADRPPAVPSVLGAAVQTRVALRLADDSEYPLIGEPLGVLGSASPPGRALLRGSEIQVANLGKHGDVAAQALRIRAMAQAMRDRGVPAAPAIERLAEAIPLLSLPASVDGRPVLGLASETFAPHTFEPVGGFLISGPPKSGRTTAVHAVVAAVRRWNPDMTVHLLSNSTRSVLAGLGCWTTTSCGPDVDEAARALLKELDGPPVVVVLENILELAAHAAMTPSTPLVELVQRCVRDGHFLVFDGETFAVQPHHGLLGAAKASRAGLALAPESADDAFRTRFPAKLNRADFPPGRALHVVGGTTSVVQIGLPDPGGAST
ncbi:FtsK/SpoIIIE domain-containing protein [Lentzea sp. NPDC005914]|uniref:FtsK/SpoIIIE domain-containing protein n=1 Tax=Lentzea sp. NPDC005914 TaxID=3154572 RepID=UPI003407E33D